MSKITLYTANPSRSGNVQWMLAECGADYDTVAVRFGADMKAPAYRAINPMGKVPALTHGDTVLTETVAIITWLAERYPQKALIPAAGSDARGDGLDYLARRRARISGDDGCPRRQRRMGERLVSHEKLLGHAIKPPPCPA